MILQELCEGGCIGTLLLTEDRFSAQRTAHYTHQILQALLYLHSCSIVHRDLKADNLLLTLLDIPSVTHYTYCHWQVCLC